MFVTENVLVLFKRAALKLTEVDGETLRLAEATFLIEPFPKELAHELGEDVAMHLFESDGRIAEAVESVGLRLRLGLQTVTVRSHPDAAPTACLHHCAVKACRAERIDELKQGKETGRSWLAFQFVLVFDLRERVHRNFVIDQFGNQLHVSFTSEQQALPLDGGTVIDAAIDGIAEQSTEAGREFTRKMRRQIAKDGGTVTLSSAGRSVTIDKDGVGTGGRS